MIEGNTSHTKLTPKTKDNHLKILHLPKLLYYEKNKYSFKIYPPKRMILTKT